MKTVTLMDQVAENNSDCDGDSFLQGRTTILLISDTRNIYLHNLNIAVVTDQHACLMSAYLR